MFAIDELIEACREALAEPEPRLAMKEVLARAVRQTGVADALPATRAEIEPLYAAADLSIMKVVWAPGMRIRPHNHLMWAAIGLYGGQEDNTYYRRIGPAIEVAGGRELRTGDVALLGDDIIHAVTNPRASFTCAIHVYGGDITTRAGRSEWDDDTLDETPYDFTMTRRAFERASAGAGGQPAPPAR